MSFMAFASIGITRLDLGDEDEEMKRLDAGENLASPQRPNDAIVYKIEDLT
jgi:hypothetical protein